MCDRRARWARLFVPVLYHSHIMQTQGELRKILHLIKEQPFFNPKYSRLTDMTYHQTIQFITVFQMLSNKKTCQ